VYGLYCQGESPQFEQHRALLEEMARSLTIERPALYPEFRDDKLRYAVKVPASWRHTGRYSGGGSHVEQFASPALGAERDQTIHASLSFNVDPGPADGRVETYYQVTRQKLGENFRVASHAPWRDGLVDVMAVDTPLASSRIKRFFRVSGGRAYSLSCEARDDVYPRISGWCDLIASTLRVGDELK
jgi:hypothetical protein